MYNFCLEEKRLVIDNRIYACSDWLCRRLRSLSDMGLRCPHANWILPSNTLFHTSLGQDFHSHQCLKTLCFVSKNMGFGAGWTEHFLEVFSPVNKERNFCRVFTLPPYLNIDIFFSLISPLCCFVLMFLVCVWFPENRKTVFFDSGCVKEYGVTWPSLIILFKCMYARIPSKPNQVVMKMRITSSPHKLCKKSSCKAFLPVRLHSHNIKKLL